MAVCRVVGLVQRWWRIVRTPWRAYTAEGGVQAPATPGRAYGGLQTAYVVHVQPDGWLQVAVLHQNRLVREHLHRHRAVPAQLLSYEGRYAASTIPAEYWLARIMADHRTSFAQGRVRLVLG